MKKFVSAFLAFILVVTSLGFGFDLKTSAAISGDYEYVVLSDGTVEITNYLGKKSSVTIPSTIAGKKVTKIGTESFAGLQLTSVSIPGSVKVIGPWAFAYNSLSSITIPNSVTAIDNNAFTLNQLTSVTLGSSVKVIEEQAFFMNNITSVSIPNSVTFIGKFAFGMNVVNKLILGTSLKTIGDFAFAVNEISSIALPKSVATIGEGAFYWNPSLKKVTIPATVKEIGMGAFGYTINEDFQDVKVPNFTITGQVNSAAITYAKDNGFKYIEQKPVLSLFISGLSDKQYTGSAITQTSSVVVKDGTKILKLDTDYTVYYTNNINAGTATVTITGKGNYVGSASKTFRITRPVSQLTIGGYSNKEYTGSPITQTSSIVVKDGTKVLKLNTDYTVSYSNNIDYGIAKITIIGKGVYTGVATKAFRINKSISNATVSGIVNKTYTGSAITQSTLVVKDGTKTLVNNTDYTISYKNNTNAGLSTLTINGKGSYAGTITKTFKITKPVSKLTVSGISNKTYTGSAIGQGTTLVVKDGTKTLAINTDYTLSYKNNVNLGTATVTITGKGNYSGSVSKTFVISLGVPKTTTTTTSKAAKITWTKTTGASGYEVYLATSSTGTYTKINTASATATAFNKTGLTSNKTYYFKVRAYRTVNGTKVYSGYSNISAIKVK